MKTIGLIGGMSWESSVLYCRLINSGINQRLGGLHSAQLLMYSLDFAAIEKLQHEGDWDGAAKLLIDAARRLETGGADFFLIGTINPATIFIAFRLYDTTAIQARQAVARALE